MRLDIFSRQRGRVIRPLCLFLLFMIVTSCTSYLKVYRNLSSEYEKKSFQVMLYWIPSERLEQIFSQAPDKRKWMIEKEIEEIAQRQDLPVTAFKNRQIERVRMANMKYGTYKQGMFTDRGRIYIKYGDPEKIVPGETDAYGPVETWFYPLYKVEFVFQVDEDHNEYRLTNIKDDRL
ncbi:MAG TPA: GWxTD domain-containing protein [Candidatus Mcinerneyibacteriales bacterium]|nr:GWxTD domain-containing protein [Candidatus Mcinerneyibacteriales bacterium]